MSAACWPAKSLAAAPTETSDPWLSEYLARRPGSPWMMGYEGVNADAAPMALQSQGRWPAELQGSLYRNGPARHRLGPIRYHHPFDADGLVQRYKIEGQSVVHQARFVRTAKFEADSAAGRPVRAAFGTAIAQAEPTRSADFVNVANTSVVWHGGEMLALWEGGSATRINRDTLTTEGLKTWSPDTAGMPFSAHPRVEPDGTMWNFGVSSVAGMMSIYQISAAGELIKAHAFKLPDIAMVHDFAVTQQHLVFLLPPLIFDLERARAGEPFLDCHVWHADRPMRALVIEKDRLDQQQWFELPTGFVFHLGNAWEETASGRIRLDYARAPNADWALNGLRDLMRGQYEREDFSGPAQVELDLRTGQARQTTLKLIGEFPRIDPRFTGRRYTQVFMAARVDALSNRPGFDAVMQLDLDTGREQHYSYGPDVMAEEHLFVPAAQGTAREAQGWVVGTALDLKRQAMLLSAFRAGRLADGPVAQAVLPRVMPLGLHANFVGA
jgi:carotenoid cleavage dioxygenase